LKAVSAIDGQAYFETSRKLVDRLLERYIPPPDREPSSLHQAMRYSVMAGGKRLRPILALAAFEYCGGDMSTAEKTIYPAMAALEMVHTYSLIHDDLPCMDDDDLRRGIPTCHKKFGEAIAVLAGDALHVVAFELMARTGNTQVVSELAEAVGTSGMLGGQVADIEAEGRPVNRQDVVNIHTRKTGALIRGAVRIGALLAGADRDTLKRLTEYGENVGLAFQIIDDILDIEGDQEILGKKVGADSKKQKATFPGAVGLKQARDEAAELIDRALDAFKDDDDNALQFIARYIGQREN
jgi:geranylgeranyl diphosphate synthase type II